jgi:voltage-gated potassium channel
MFCEEVTNPNKKLHKTINFLVNFFTLFFLFILVAESIWDWATKYRTIFFIIDFIVSTIFALEYFLYFHCSKNKKYFIFSIWRIIDFLSFAPFFILLFVGLFITHIKWNFDKIISILVVLRLFRIFKVLRLLDKIPLTSWFIHSLKEYKDEYKAVFILFFTVLYILSFAVYFFEHNINPHINNMLDALRWGLVTITTVWYGDIVPITPIWKIMASFLIFLWPIVLWIFSAITVMVFMDNTERHRYIIFNKLSKRIKFCPKCNTKNLKEANYCMKCWFKLISTDEVFKS